MKSMCDIFERASIDEAFMDITSSVKQRINSNNHRNQWFGKILGESDTKESSKDLETMLKIG